MCKLWGGEGLFYHLSFVFNQRVFFHAERFVRFLEATRVFQLQRSVPGGGASVVVLGGANFEIESATQESREDFFLFVLEFLLKILGFLIICRPRPAKWAGFKASGPGKNWPHRVLSAIDFFI